MLVSKHVPRLAVINQGVLKTRAERDGTDKGGKIKERKEKR